MAFFRSVFLIINYKTILVTIVAVMATWYCMEFDKYANFPLTLIGIAIVFPIVFSINSAYKRRERALFSLAELKGYSLGVFQTARNHLKEKSDVKDLNNHIIELFRSVYTFLQSDMKDARTKEKSIYENLSKVGDEIRILSDKGLAGRYASRMNQYLTRSMVAIDMLKVIFYYRTPRTLRAYSKVFIYLFPIVYAPYFASIGIDFAPYLGYLMPIFFSFIFVSLDNIQEHLESPYDQIGEDDIKFRLEEIEEMLI